MHLWWNFEQNCWDYFHQMTCIRERERELTTYSISLQNYCSSREEAPAVYSFEGVNAMWPQSVFDPGIHALRHREREGTLQDFPVGYSAHTHTNTHTHAHKHAPLIYSRQLIGKWADGYRRCLCFASHKNQNSSLFFGLNSPPPPTPLHYPPPASTPPPSPFPQSSLVYSRDNLEVKWRCLNHLQEVSLRCKWQELKIHPWSSVWIFQPHPPPLSFFTGGGPWLSQWHRLGAQEGGGGFTLNITAGSLRVCVCVCVKESVCVRESVCMCASVCCVCVVCV